MFFSWHFKFSFLIFFLFIFLLFSVINSFSLETKEEVLKTAFVFNFLKFVDWPENISSITLCVFGKTKLKQYLLGLDGQKIKNKVLHVKIVPVEKIESCQAIFVGKVSPKEWRYFVSFLSRESILTISDQEAFLEKGGIIELFLDDYRLRFRINLKAAHRAHLQISSRLLKLAKEVIK